MSETCVCLPFCWLNPPKYRRPSIKTRATGVPDVLLFYFCDIVVIHIYVWYIHTKYHTYYFIYIYIIHIIHDAFCISTSTSWTFHFHIPQETIWSVNLPLFLRQDSQDTRREWHKSSSFGASSSETSHQMVGYKIPYPDITVTRWPPTSYK